MAQPWFRYELAYAFQIAHFDTWCCTGSAGWIAVAITPLFEKTAILHTKPEGPRFVAFVATALLTLTLTPVVIVRGKSAVVKLSLHRRDLFLASLIAGVAPVLGYTAFRLGFVGYVTTLFRLSTLMTVIGSFLFLKEGRVAARLLGSLIMVVGAILITT